jgi:O-antigen ligase
MLSLCLSKDFQENSMRALGYIALTCALIASIWSSTRGGWISIPVSIVILSILGRLSRKELAIILVAVVIAFSFSDRAQNRIAATFSSGGTSFFDGSTTQRIQMWEISYLAFLDHPITGNGLDSFHTKKIELIEQDLVNQALMPHKHSHNELMEIIASRGIIGLSLMILIFGYLFQFYITNRKGVSSGYDTSGIMVLSQFLIFSLSENFLSTKLTIIYFIIVNAFLVAGIIVINEKEGSK